MITSSTEQDILANLKVITFKLPNVLDETKGMQRRLGKFYSEQTWGSMIFSLFGNHRRRKNFLFKMCTLFYNSREMPLFVPSAQCMQACTFFLSKHYKLITKKGNKIKLKEGEPAGKRFLHTIVLLLTTKTHYGSTPRIPRQIKTTF